MQLLTAAQMRAVEQAAIESGEVTGLELMERAGAGVVAAIFEEWPELDKGEESRNAVVLCGPGNNGGDGFVVARLLKQRGWEVAVYLYGDAEKLPPDARVNYQRWCELGEVQALSQASWQEQAFMRKAHLLVDGLFGAGLTRPVDLPLSALQSEPAVGQIHKTIAIDLPSGMCSDSGRIIGDEGQAVWADLTVTFQQRKLAHFLADGPEGSGKVVVKDIGLGEGHRPEWPDNRVTLTLPSPNHKPSGHKYSHGHALVLSGGSGKTGAARLAARGALRIGAGIVTLGVPPAAMAEVAAQVTAIMLRKVEDSVSLADALEDPRINTLCIGPGMGLQRVRNLLPEALRSGRGCVFDAGALSAYEGDPEELFEMLHENCVLTPHGGEFARLFPDLAAKLDAPATEGPAYSKVDATREAAKRAGCVVLFKGPDTVIAHPGGHCSINAALYDREAPWLATAGAGDVLAGFITGLMARGFDPLQAAETAAWLHVECALEFGPGLIAEDLPEILPQVLRRPTAA